jgi:hypothetical protein
VFAALGLGDHAWHVVCAGFAPRVNEPFGREEKFAVCGEKLSAPAALRFGAKLGLNRCAGALNLERLHNVASSM